MNLLQRVRSRADSDEQRYSLEDYAAQVASFMYSGHEYGGLTQTWKDDKNGRRTETSASPFEHWVQAGYKSNGIVFACQLARLSLFTEARFQFQRMNDGRPGDLYGSGYGTSALSVLERPWVNGSTGELLARMIQDLDLAGNAYVRRTGPMADPALERLRPDWVDIVLGRNPDLLNDEVVGYLFHPGGRAHNRDPIALSREEVAHWSFLPDPVATYRGMSWLSPILREIRADGAATDHKQKFWDHAATPNMVIKFDPSVDAAKVERFKAMIEDKHAGYTNAYKNLYLGGGADATVVGADFKQMDFKAVQGAGETRIAAAAGVPPIVVGLSEGLEAATYSNYAQARRRFADLTVRPLWRSACAALSSIVKVPAGSRLYYDDRDIPALKEDEKDAAAIESVKATTINSLVTAGFTPKSVVDAVMSEDMRLLKHSGLYSVQLQKAGADAPATKPAEPSMNGADDPQGVNA